MDVADRFNYDPPLPEQLRRLPAILKGTIMPFVPSSSFPSQLISLSRLGRSFSAADLCLEEALVECRQHRFSFYLTTLFLRLYV
jgi:hypothetical protein